MQLLYSVDEERRDAIIEIYVDYKPNYIARDCAGAHEAPGDPHREDRCDRARVCWVAIVSASLRSRFQGDGFRYRYQEGDRPGCGAIVHLPDSGGGDSERAEAGLCGHGGVLASVRAGRDYYVRAYPADGASRAGPELRGEYGEGRCTVAAGGPAGGAGEHDLSGDDGRADDSDPRRGEQAWVEGAGLGDAGGAWGVLCRVL